MEICNLEEYSVGKWILSHYYGGNFSNFVLSLSISSQSSFILFYVVKHLNDETKYKVHILTDIPQFYNIITLKTVIYSSVHLEE